MKNNSENVRSAGWSYHRLCTEYDNLLIEFSKLHKACNSHDELVAALQVARYEVKDWHEYNYNQIDSFDGRERDMQIDVANGIREKLDRIESALKKIESLQKSSS